MRHFHLDDEALSAALDGEGTHDEQVHLDSCPSCRARFDGLRAVALAVGMAVPRRPEQAVDAAIQAALSSADELDHADQADRAASIVTASEGASGGAGAPRPASRQADSYPATQRRAGLRPGAGHRPGGHRFGAGSPRYARLVLAAAAAAVVAVVLGAGLLARASGPGSTSKVASGAARGLATPNAAPGQPGEAGKPSQAGSGAAIPSSAPGVASRQGVAAGVVRGVSLGDQADPLALARIVDSQLAAGAVPNQSPEVSGAAAVPIPCADQGAAIGGAPGQPLILRYAAPVRWRDQDALVLVYARPAGGLVGMVIRPQDCAALTTFNP